MDWRQVSRARGLGKWGLVLLGITVASVALWGFSTRVQGAEQTASTYQGTAATAAKAAYDTAVEKLNLLRSKPLPAELADAQSKADAAKASYDSALAKLEQTKKGATAQDLQQAEGSVAAA